MADVNDVLAANRAAVLDLVAAAERSAATWTTPRAPGKWSPVVLSAREGMSKSKKPARGRKAAKAPAKKKAAKKAKKSA